MIKRSCLGIQLEDMSYMFGIRPRGEQLELQLSAINVEPYLNVSIALFMITPYIAIASVISLRGRLASSSRNNGSTIVSTVDIHCTEFCFGYYRDARIRCNNLLMYVLKVFNIHGVRLTIDCVYIRPWPRMHAVYAIGLTSNSNSMSLHR